MSHGGEGPDGSSCQLLCGGDSGVGYVLNALT